VNGRRQKGQILLRRMELLASSFDPCLCGGKTIAAAIDQPPQFRRLRAPSRPAPAAKSRTVTDVTATNQQPSGKDAIEVSNR
jgi:hypothetical protein